MKKAWIILIGWFIVLLSSFGTAMPQNMTITHDSIYSAILKEKRGIEVLLPENYRRTSIE